MKKMSGWLKNRETLNFSIIEREKEREEGTHTQLGTNHFPHLSLHTLSLGPDPMRKSELPVLRLSDDIQSNMNQ